MLHPSYAELMKVVNDNDERVGEEPMVNSRYSIVIATAKRARQIVDGYPTEDDKNARKALSIAVDELNSGKVKIVTEEQNLPED